MHMAHMKQDEMSGEKLKHHNAEHMMDMMDMGDDRHMDEHMSHEKSHMDMSHACCGNMSMPMDHHYMMMDFKKRFFVSFILMIPILMLSPMIQHFMGLSWRFAGDFYLLFGLSTILFFYGGKPFFWGAKAELKTKKPAMMMLITLAITIAYGYSTLTVFGLGGVDFFWELATLIVIMLLGHWIEMKSVMGASKALDDLVALMPAQAHKLNPNGTVIDVPTADLKVGDLVLVRPGEKIPIDGVVYEGKSDVNESMATGESIPVLKQDHSSVIGGSLNGDGVLKIRITKVGADTFLSQVVSMVRRAQESKSETQVLMDKAAGWLFYIAVTAGIVTFTGWMLAGAALAFAIERAVTVIIITCPHALGLAAPLVTAVSVSLAAKNGLLIRNRAAFEKAHEVNAVVFDKTGTLTQGSFGVTDMYASAITPEILLTLAASIENNSSHPIGKGIVAAALARKLPMKTVTDFKNLPGQGAEGIIENRHVKIVSPNYLMMHKITYDTQTYERALDKGQTVVFVLIDEKPIGWIALNDIIRDAAKEAIKALKERQIQTIMLTGDNAHVAEQVGQSLKMDEIIAGVLPAEKGARIAELQKDRKIVAMTGDGINDAPALARADVGIAIGAGTDIAIETADVVLVNNDPMGVVRVLDLSCSTYRKMVENLFWATGYNILAIPLAAGVLYPWGIMISPAVGAVLMSMSTIIVAVNARLLKLK